MRTPLRTIKATNLGKPIPINIYRWNSTNDGSNSGKRPSVPSPGDIARTIMKTRGRGRGLLREAVLKANLPPLPSSPPSEIQVDKEHSIMSAQEPEIPRERQSVSEAFQSSFGIKRDSATEGTPKYEWKESRSAAMNLEIEILDQCSKEENSPSPPIQPVKQVRKTPKKTVSGRGRGRTTSGSYAAWRDTMVSDNMVNSPSETEKKPLQQPASSRPTGPYGLLDDLQAILTRQKSPIFPSQGLEEPGQFDDPVSTEANETQSQVNERSHEESQIQLHPGLFHRFPLRRTNRKIYDMKPRQLIDALYLYEPAATDLANYDGYFGIQHMGSNIIPINVMTNEIQKKITAYVGGHYEDYQISQSEVAALAEGCSEDMKQVLSMMRTVLNNNPSYNMTQKREVLETVKAFVVDKVKPEVKEVEGFKWLHSKRQPGESLGPKSQPSL